MRWNGTVLGPPETLLENFPGGGIHNGSRIVVGPDRMLYVTAGDAGDGDVAQDLESLGGKILRLTLDGRPAPGNPFDNAVWSYGHRNPQGLVFHPSTGVLYETEHGPSDNDEVNIIRRGGNYGWPTVHGFCDDDVGSERAFCRAHAVVEPLAAWTPTIAITGADFYLSDRIPGWRGSLLATSLKAETLFRFTLSPDGSKIVAREALLATRYGRLARRARGAEWRRLRRDEQSRRPRIAEPRRRPHPSTHAEVTVTVCSPRSARRPCSTRRASDS